jgi:hypothetical protein
LDNIFPVRAKDGQPPISDAIRDENRSKREGVRLAGTMIVADRNLNLEIGTHNIEWSGKQRNIVIKNHKETQSGDVLKPDTPFNERQTIITYLNIVIKEALPKAFGEGCYMKRILLDRSQSYTHPQFPMEIIQAYATALGLATIKGNLSLVYTITPRVKILSTENCLNKIQAMKSRCGGDERAYKSSSKEFLLNQQVFTSYNKTGYQIVGVNWNKCPNDKFTLRARKGNPEEEISFAEYLKRVHNVQLHQPNEPPLLEVTKGMGSKEQILLCPEQCQLTDIPPQAKAALPRECSKKPKEHMDGVMSFVQKVKDDAATKDVLKKFGIEMKFGEGRSEIAAEVLPPPRVRVMGGSTFDANQDFGRDMVIGRNVNFRFQGQGRNLNPILVIAGGRIDENSLNAQWNDWFRLMNELNCQYRFANQQAPRIYVNDVRDVASLEQKIGQCVQQKYAGAPIQSIFIGVFMEDGTDNRWKDRGQGRDLSVHAVYRAVADIASRKGFIKQGWNMRSKQNKNIGPIVQNTVKQIIHKYGENSWDINLYESAQVLKNRFVLIIGLDVYHSRTQTYEKGRLKKVRCSYGAYCAEVYCPDGSATKHFTQPVKVLAKEEIQQVDTDSGEDTASNAATSLSKVSLEGEDVVSEIDITSGGKLGNFVKGCVDFIKKHPKYPSSNGLDIIVYRDGVGDSQLDSVERHELEQCMNAAGGDAKVSLTFMVCQKGIDERFTTVDDSNPGNPAKGSVVNGMGSTKYQSFFLVSCNCSLSTSRPVRYQIITSGGAFNNVDSNAQQLKELQKLTYDLCHLYTNWSDAIKVPMVVQNAHKLAYQAGEADLPEEIAPSLKSMRYYL